MGGWKVHKFFLGNSADGRARGELFLRALSHSEPQRRLQLKKHLSLWHTHTLEV